MRSALGTWGWEVRVRCLISVALAAVALSVVVGCGSTATELSPSASMTEPSPSASISTGISGIVLTNRGGFIGSPSPVALPGGFGVVNDRYPFPGVPVIINRVGADGSLRVVARLHADAQGLFSCTLPPGKYVAVCPVPSAGKERVVVRQGSVSRMRVEGGFKF
jgi:hypothetical protein